MGGLPWCSAQLSCALSGLVNLLQRSQPSIRDGATWTAHSTSLRLSRSRRKKKMLLAGSRSERLGLKIWSKVGYGFSGLHWFVGFQVYTGSAECRAGPCYSGSFSELLRRWNDYRLPKVDIQSKRFGHVK